MSWSLRPSKNGRETYATCARNRHHLPRPRLNADRFYKHNVTFPCVKSSCRRTISSGRHSLGEKLIRYWYVEPLCCVGCIYRLSIFCNEEVLDCRVFRQEEKVWFVVALFVREVRCLLVMCLDTRSRNMTRNVIHGPCRGWEWWQ